MLGSRKRQKGELKQRGMCCGSHQHQETCRAPIISVWLLIVLSGWLTTPHYTTHLLLRAPSMDNAVSYTSLLHLIKNRQIDVTSMVELYLTLTRTTQLVHTHPSSYIKARMLPGTVLSLQISFILFLGR